MYRELPYAPLWSVLLLHVAKIDECFGHHAWLLPSTHAANQCENRWLLKHRQGPQHCLAKCWLVSLFLRGSTACPTITASPAAPSSTHLLCLL
jgi:hypothetical protein